MKRIDPAKRAATRIACATLLVPWLRRELEALGYEIQQEDHLGVQVGASLIECMSLALQLRTASHVLWQIARFRCPTLKSFRRELASVPWEELIPVDGYFTIRCSVTHPSIDNDLYANRLVKDLIADRFVERFGKRPDSGPERSGVVIHVHWHDERVIVYLNVNGRPLSDRGYRRMPHLAPLRETLAAAILMAARYDGTTPLVNPMCGSGTLAIEAALIATGRAPGLLRSDYAITQTALGLDDAWREARASARKRSSAQAEHIPPIVANDHDPRAVEATLRNAAVAGVERLIQVDRCDFTQTPLPTLAASGRAGIAGHIVMNPEYGQRLGETEGLARTYAMIGDFFKQHATGWRGHVLTGNPTLAKRIGLRAAQRTPFMNGGLECRLLTYDIYAGREPTAEASEAQVGDSL
jgi:23S rRNA G2445 N2-methylase RlmL